MKKLVFMLFVLGLLVGCDSYNGMKCYKSVVDKYPEGEVIVIPGQKYGFIVIDGDDILFVTTMNQTNADVSDAVKIKTLKR